MDGKIKHFKSELTVANGKVVYGTGQDPALAPQLPAISGPLPAASPSALGTMMFHFPAASYSIRATCRLSEPAPLRCAFGA
jgi:hypothetical protein